MKLKYIISTLLVSFTITAYSAEIESSGNQLKVPVNKRIETQNYLVNTTSSQIIEQKDYAIKSLNNERQRYEWAISKLNDQAQSLKGYLKNSQDTVQKLKIELDLQRQRNKNLSIELQAEKQNASRLEATVSTLNSQIALREKAIEELTTYVENDSVNNKNLVPLTGGNN